MKTQKMVNRSPSNKNIVFDNLALENVPEIDPGYKLFLENLREDGSSYVLDVPRGDHGSVVFVRYGEDGATYGDAEAQYGANVPNNSLHGKGPAVTSDKAANVDVGHSFSGTSSVAKTSEVDESYATFLNLMRIKDGHMVIEPEPGVTIVYGQAEEASAGIDELRIGSFTNERDSVVTGLERMKKESAINKVEDGLRKINSSTSELEMVRLASENMGSEDVVCTDQRKLVPYTEFSDVKACEDDREEHHAVSSSIASTFDEKLNAVLRKPYDLNEYEELLRKATDRKAVIRQRHLRSASKDYATGQIGLSYLDYYPDLAKQINSADSDERKLYLLRKLFFWLENLCHEGAYMPWINKSLACNPIDVDAYTCGMDSEPSVEIVEDED